jgi:hypothetical protein
MSKGDNPEVGDGVRIVLPSEHVGPAAQGRPHPFG